MEKKFNIGDRVRFKGDYQQYVEDAVSNNEEYLITDVGHDSSEVTLHCPVFIDNDDLELVEPADPKTAFLSELKGLLEKYGAAIDCSDFDTDGEWWYEKWLSIKIGEEVIRWFDDGDRATENRGRKPPKSHFPITPDNIMDYDKE